MKKGSDWLAEAESAANYAAIRWLVDLRKSSAALVKASSLIRTPNLGPVCPRFEVRFDRGGFRFWRRVMSSHGGMSRIDDEVVPLGEVDGDVPAMSAYGVPAKDPRELLCCTRLGIWGDSRYTGEPSQQALGRAEALAQALHVQVAVAL